MFVFRQSHNDSRLETAGQHAGAGDGHGTGHRGLSRRPRHLRGHHWLRVHRPRGHAGQPARHPHPQ